ncbi:MAG: Maf family nucleotide pyrophosphatase [Alphaproteobacteria bacterium]|nr:Maf family nucleotide pyrophosphatase [Alphaproteobacteria bacterium]
MECRGTDLILASESPRRLALLRQVGIEPDFLFSSGINESAVPGESPRDLACRLASLKVSVVANRSAQDKSPAGCYILGADTVVSVGTRVLPKPCSTSAAASCLRLLSGRAHRVFTGLCLRTPGEKQRLCLVETRLRFKRLCEEEIKAYLASGEWQGKSGGYAIQGLASAFVVKLAGSYTNVVGLPLHETVALLEGEGYRVIQRWQRTS